MVFLDLLSVSSHVLSTCSIVFSPAFCVCTNLQDISTRSLNCQGTFEVSSVHTLHGIRGQICAKIESRTLLSNLLFSLVLRPLSI
ncbi:hypothetical protein BO86DRAFT_11854 [Aspergillus japonicus CBS 114.51]|uniref:Secreted protein n=1 Tax=Aspergillus japonicus CBS 114.51 TaxID=1448312 RepID=A0A8T8X7F9_ASPJA|nr:hypothetical protein BO86DRAFT_11854 [Aspergillus japonicus CBS 114.51]RAH84087.1 hypothetical protein BO86DRAFT_11854 [Aspergillus japonicus CBS 114.51]